MRQITGFTLVLVLVGTGGIPCFAQSKPMAAMKQPGGIQPYSAADKGVVPLTYPYSISTEPHFAVFVEFPKADSIRRIALGDSNYFLAEADKTDPHYAIIKQIEAPAAKGKTAIETNMLVYMASGRVVNINLKAGKLDRRTGLALLQCEAPGRSGAGVIRCREHVLGDRGLRGPAGQSHYSQQQSKGPEKAARENGAGGDYPIGCLF